MLANKSNKPAEDRYEYGTGAVRSSDCKTERWDLISPIAMQRLAQVYAEGAEKYGANNWEMGMPVWSILNHALRHIFLYQSGDDTEDHLGHALWGMAAAVHSAEMAARGIEPWARINADMRRRPNGEVPAHAQKAATAK